MYSIIKSIKYNQEKLLLLTSNKLKNNFNEYLTYCYQTNV